ncbi:MAG TPA: tetratricopeptide repeat protein [Arenicellales bacterium]|jgi:predicted negative regulator of RcsB-dependent stress response|nr:tetratricopeptide repeat protein [Arenicellales bacterium]
MAKKEEKPIQIQLAEDDDAEKLRQWWKKNGSGIIAGIVLGVAGVGGVKGWEMYTERRSLTASDLFQQMLARQAVGSDAQAQELALQIRDDYGATPYADLALLMLARLAVENGDRERAEGYLTGVMNDSENMAMEHIARLRLAQIALDAGDHRQAEQLVSVEERGGFESEYSEVLGDVYLEQKQWDKARTAYDRALEGLDPTAGAGQILTAKRNLAMQSATDQ